MLIIVIKLNLIMSLKELFVVINLLMEILNIVFPSYLV